MVPASILSHAEFGPNDHRKDAPHFISFYWNLKNFQQKFLSFSFFYQIIFYITFLYYQFFRWTCPSSQFQSQFLAQAMSFILTSRKWFLGVNSLVWIMQLLREVNLGGGAGFWEDIVHNVLSTSFLLDLSSINTTRLVDTNPQSFTLTKELTSSKPNYVTLLSNR